MAAGCGEAMRIVDANCMFGVWPRAELDASLPTVLKLLAGAGVQEAVVASLQAALYDDAAGNREVQEACREQAGLLPAGGLSLRRALAVEGEVECLRAQGFRLLRLFREYEGWPIDYAPLGLAMTAAGRAGLPVMLAAAQPGDITALGRALAGRPCTVVLTGVNTSHTPLVAEAVAVGRECPELWFDTSRLEGADTMEVMAGELGAGRLVFGTGLPFQYPSSAVAVVAESDLSSEDKAAILGGNILRLVGTP